MDGTAEIISLCLAAINTCVVVIVWLQTRARLGNQGVEITKAHLALIDIALARIEERLKTIERVMEHRYPVQDRHEI